MQAVLSHLENTIASSIHKKGAGEFTLPGLFKVSAIQVRRPRTNASTRIRSRAKSSGSQPSRLQSRWRVRTLKKLKDAAL